MDGLRARGSAPPGPLLGAMATVTAASIIWTLFYEPLGVLRATWVDSGYMFMRQFWRFLEVFLIFHVKADVGS